VKKLAVDLCNTISDINSVLEHLLGPNPNPNDYLHPKVFPGYIENNLWIFEKAKPLLGALTGVEQLSRNHKIIYLTARPEVSKDVTLKWLKKWGFPDGEVIFTNNKAKAVVDLDIIGAIDDAPHEIERLSKVVQVAVHTQPYNKTFANRFTWNQKKYPVVG